MTLTKKEAAQLCLDALQSEDKLKRKVIIVAINVVIIAGLIAIITSWHFGLAMVLICGLLGQFAHERMENSIEARKLLAIKSLNWQKSELENPELITKLSKIIG
tara:strand:- start:4 stop:315 length:312 start_codon:yes stop_codon:yes gene_type:complete